MIFTKTLLKLKYLISILYFHTNKFESIDRQLKTLHREKRENEEKLEMKSEEISKKPEHTHTTDQEKQCLPCMEYYEPIIRDYESKIQKLRDHR